MNTLSKVTIGTRLAIGFTCVLALIAIVNISSTHHLQSIGGLNKSRLMLKWQAAVQLTVSRIFATVKNSNPVEQALFQAHPRRQSNNVRRLSSERRAGKGYCTNQSSRHSNERWHSIERRDGGGGHLGRHLNARRSHSLSPGGIAVLNRS